VIEEGKEHGKMRGRERGIDERRRGMKRRRNIKGK